MEVPESSIEYNIKAQSALLGILSFFTTKVHIYNYDFDLQSAYHVQ